MSETMGKFIKNNYTTPKFLLAETPIKDGTFNDDRIWIYCPFALSLIEFVCLDDFADYNFKNNDYFIYTNVDGDDEHWAPNWTQNNCELCEVDENEVMANAIEFFKKHLTQLDTDYND